MFVFPALSKKLNTYTLLSDKFKAQTYPVLQRKFRMMINMSECERTIEKSSSKNTRRCVAIKSSASTRKYVARWRKAGGRRPRKRPNDLADRLISQRLPPANSLPLPSRQGAGAWRGRTKWSAIKRVLATAREQAVVGRNTTALVRTSLLDKRSVER